VRAGPTGPLVFHATGQAGDVLRLEPAGATVRFRF
jgi:hypothetical protein